MPLLCISLLVLLLLPSSLSCDSKNSPQDVRDDYELIVRVHLEDAKENLAALMQNSSCTPRGTQRCQGNATTADILDTLLSQACRMQKPEVPEKAKDLATRVQSSIRCLCPKKPTKDPNSKEERERKTKQRRNTKRETRRGNKKKCKVMKILSSMSDCYQMLNILLTDT